MINDLVLGTMYFGTRTDRDASFALLDRFVEAGGRWIDTANCYAFWAHESGHGGQSEIVIGEWLRANPGVREQVALATKVGVEPVDGGVEGLSAPVVRSGAMASRERLGIETIDLFWAHARDMATPIEETVEAMGILVDDGVATRLGLSNHATWQVERARAHAIAQGLETITALQLSTSYVEARPGAAVEGKDHRFGWVTEETRDYVEQHPEVEVWAYSPLIQGSYDRADRPFPSAYDHPGTTARLAALGEAAGRLGVAPSVVVLAWLLRRGIKPILGVSSLEQLDSGLAAGELALDDEAMAQLDAPA
ncbi:aldo/keto reductase [Nocardioides sp.]|uniref:aldo/keto reductase n=1 Tax=Nocardioides sp. TaxID=35761 RepID=UPI0035B4BCBC